jgi:type II secretory pathway pseudopilin PulG
MRQALTIRPNRHNRRDRQDRLAFTLVELLVVMTIIIVLMGLSLAGVQRIRSKARELKVRSDISQLEAAIASFKTNYQVAYIPSRIVLREDGMYGTNADPIIRAWEQQSIVYLKKVWPRLATPLTPGFAGIDWNNDNKITVGDAGAWVLEGDQCLVFFLGGAQQNQGGAVGCLGFSTDPRNPMSQQARRSSPNADFTSDRLAVLPNGGYKYRSDQFATFLDPFSTPYAYFSSTYGNDYDYNWKASNQQVWDCDSFGGVFQLVPYPNTGTFSIVPYFDSNLAPNVIFYNRDGFQIICAGKNKLFGAGGGWSIAQGYSTANAITGQPEPGIDDFSNFHAMNMGSGTQAQ